VDEDKPRNLVNCLLSHSPSRYQFHENYSTTSRVIRQIEVISLPRKGNVSGWSRSIVGEHTATELEISIQ